MGWGWWTVAALLVLVTAVLVRDRGARRRVLRGLVRRWERRGRQAKTSVHGPARPGRASGGQVARAPFERPKRARLGAQKCSAACRTSRKPAFDPKTGVLRCDCPCGGREHGLYRKGSTAKPNPPRRATGTSGTQRSPATAKPPTPAPAARPKLPHTAAATKPVPVQTVPRAEPKRWNGLQVASWDAMRRHAEQSPRCAGGTFSAQTFRDRRTDPPKVTQQIKCDTCGKGC